MWLAFISYIFLKSNLIYSTTSVILVPKVYNLIMSAFSSNNSRQKSICKLIDLSNALVNYSNFSSNLTINVTSKPLFSFVNSSFSIISSSIIFYYLNIEYYS